MTAPKNPLREGLVTERIPPPCTVVIFGASGDLTKRKLLPALYNLAVSRLLPPGASVVGYARREVSDEQFRDNQKKNVAEFSRRKPLDEAIWNDFAQGLHYVSGTFEDPKGYDKLKAKLDELDKTRGTRGNRLYYLSVPPSEFSVILERLRAAGLVEKHGGDKFTRVIIEKPFGTDLQSGEALNEKLLSVFDERQVFRIDHYLGKETVQNLLRLRFANSIFEPLWNREHVDHVEITVAEDIGVEGRGKFYEEAGTTRDVVQNHLLQILSVMAMEPPVALDADALRNEKVKVVRALRPLTSTEDIARDTVRGQYVAGSFNGQPVPGYREEPDVAKDSKVETYVAIKAHIDNWRWGGVPFYLRAGKRLNKRVTEISIEFKRVPHALFAQSGGVMEPDVLSIRIQPDEGITLRFMAKVPGPEQLLRPVTMDFRYGTSFGETGPEAYERLLLEAMLGDATLFARNDEVKAAWEYITPLLEAWKAMPAPEPYPAGSWGPESADALMHRDDRHWRRL
ncbi:MAG: glucose-6-phosphate dehydrogenase [Polyangiales bacterium]